MRKNEAVVAKTAGNKRSPESSDYESSSEQDLSFDDKIPRTTPGKKDNPTKRPNKRDDYDSRDDSSSYYTESEASSRRRTYTEESKGVPTPKNKNKEVLADTKKGKRSTSYYSDESSDSRYDDKDDGNRGRK